MLDRVMAGGGMADRLSLARRAGEVVSSLFDVDAEWTRPGPGPDGVRTDAAIAVGFFVFGAVGLELTRSMGALREATSSVPMQYAALLLGIVPLVWRRRFPISVMLLLQAHLFLAGIWLDAVAYQFTMQVAYFFALFSGVAWARDRRAVMYAVGAVLLLMFGWLTWSVTLGHAYDALLASARPGDGLIGPMAATAAYAFLTNAAYFGGAVLWGRSAWRSARQLATLRDQAATIATQAAELRDQAVVEERLRIARELHDVAAHHVSVMGVQAAAARRVLTRNPEAASTALAAVEESSRAAVGEMRALLGTLRGGGSPTPYDGGGVATDDLAAAADPARPGGAPAANGGPGRSAPDDCAASHRRPDPGLPEIAALVEAARRPGFAVTYELVQDGPDALAAVPAPLALSTYRIVQEALSNVRKHSTATRVGVVVRVARQGGGYVEAEVVDDGRPIGATSGTGLGLLGMRERIASHAGQLDVGPRLLGGYRVRVRFPLVRPVGDGPRVVLAAGRDRVAP